MVQLRLRSAFRFRPRTILWACVGALVLFAAIQAVPYGRDHTARPAPRPFRWASPAAETLARAACYDCHSNETRWWWAVKVAPFSWLAQSDIDEAKRRVDFSDWNGKLTPEALRRALQDGMPPLQYTLFHADAKLTSAMQETLAQGFAASLADAAPPAAASQPADGDAPAIIQARCSACHSADKALGFHAANADKAKRLLDQMVKKGATLSAAETQTLIGYYTR